MPPPVPSLQGSSGCWSRTWCPGPSRLPLLSRFARGTIPSSELLPLHINLSDRLMQACLPALSTAALGPRPQVSSPWLGRNHRGSCWVGTSDFNATFFPMLLSLIMQAMNVHWAVILLHVWDSNTRDSELLGPPPELPGSREECRGSQGLLDLGGFPQEEWSNQRHQNFREEV